MEGGIGDAVRQVIELAEKTKATKIVEVPAEKRGSYLLVGPDGKGELKLAGPAWHDEKLDTPSELAAFVKVWSSTDGATFVTDDQAVTVRNLHDRRDRASCTLRQSPQYLWLKSPAKQMTQAEFVRLLRIDFAGCVASENLLAILKQIKFDSTDGGGSTIEHGRQSMGRSVTAAVTGIDAIPEETAVIVPVFENHPFKALVRCAVEIFPAERTFRLTPYPLEVKNAMDAAMADIIEKLGGDGLPPVYRGKP